MKVKNGFVSNSSSSSFIITLPKDKKIRLSEMEDYLGGYSDELTDDQKDELSYFLWKTIKSKHHSIEEPIEHHEECSANWDERKQLEKEQNCLGYSWWSYEDGLSPKECKNCKFLKTTDRPARTDDYYRILDNEWITNKSILDENKSNYYIEIDDNEPGDYLDYDDAYDFRRIDKLFKDTNKVVEV